MTVFFLHYIMLAVAYIAKLTLGDGQGERFIVYYPTGSLHLHDSLKQASLKLQHKIIMRY